MTLEQLLEYNTQLGEYRRRIRAEQLRVNAEYSRRVRTQELAQAIGVGAAEGTIDNGNA